MRMDEILLMKNQGYRTLFPVIVWKNRTWVLIRQLYLYFEVHSKAEEGACAIYLTFSHFWAKNTPDVIKAYILF